MPPDANDRTYRHAREADVAAMTRVMTLSFAGSADLTERWLHEHDIATVRLLEHAGSILGCARRVPMGLFVGGRRVAMEGVCGVCVAPEARGKGVARDIMTRFVRELHDDGVPIATLYPSTQALYRQIGFEQAGSRFLASVPLARLPQGSKSRSVVPLTEADLPRLEPIARDFARRFGGIERGRYLWKRVFRLRDKVYNGFGVLDASGALGGYLFLHLEKHEASGRLDVLLSDLAFSSVEHARSLLAFLADYEPMGRNVVFAAGPCHPVLSLLDQQRYETSLNYCWMLRIVRLKEALESRGYPSCVRGDLLLDARDDVLPANERLWRLRIEGGTGRVEEAGKNEAVGGLEIPRLRLDVRGLAAIYTGFWTPRQAALAGWCEGDEAAFDLAGTAFAQGAPWMIDQF